MTKTHPNQSRGILISLTILKNTCLFAAFSYGLSYQGTTDSRKNLEQRFIFQIGTLNFHGINERFSFNYTPHNSSICSDEELTLETSAFQSLYGGQFTLSTPLINQIFVFYSPTDAAPQFLQKLTPFTHVIAKADTRRLPNNLYA